MGPGERLVFYSNGLLEARDRAGRCFQLEGCRDTLRRTDLQAAADELLGRLLADTGRRLDHDVTVLLFEAASPPARPQDQPAPCGSRHQPCECRLRSDDTGPG